MTTPVNALFDHSVHTVSTENPVLVWDTEVTMSHRGDFPYFEGSTKILDVDGLHIVRGGVDDIIYGGDKQEIEEVI